MSALTLLCGVLLGSCSNGSDSPAVAGADGRAPAFLADPALEASRYAWTPLVPTIDVRTSEPTRLRVRFDDGDQYWEVLATQDLTDGHEDVALPGMRPGVTYDIWITAVDADGNAVQHPKPIRYAPPALPMDFPPLRITKLEPGQMEPGYTALNIFNLGPGPATGYAVILDSEGQVVWYFDGSRHPSSNSSTFNAYHLTEGKVNLCVGRVSHWEVDLSGHVDQIWTAVNAGGVANQAPNVIPLATDTLHHEIGLRPDGLPGFAALGTELRVYPDYPNDPANPASVDPMASVIGDTILEFEPDGSVASEIRLFDILDPYRMTWSALSAFWNPIYPSIADTQDWSHGNALHYDKADDSWLVSLRHQDCVIKVDRQSGQLVWIMGDPNQWGPQFQSKLLTPIGGNFEWQYHQHAPMITKSGNILLYDNGNNRSIPPTPAMPFSSSYSRAVEYRVDEANMTVEQVWVYGGPTDPSHPFYSSFVCDADELPITGNVLVADGGRRVDGPGSQLWSRAVEVTKTVPPVEIFEVEVRDTSVNPANYAMYRAQRIPTLYPGQGTPTVVRKR